ncbi:17309_t:CDS:2 [Dentiscutata heterogama]|uniref:17309_t:CDS:1 n=1 Tax=Dentiscutata heterogama TaxID=1316150 RepID=A0ACA9JW97_9GLOM|nr:17309_t:CDS:2 [Dentiscutata heterogama]
MSSKERSRLACIECKLSKRRCEYNYLHKRCKRCMELHIACTYPSTKKRQKHSVCSLGDEDYQISEKGLFRESTLSIEKNNLRLSNKCSYCRRSKKKCEYNGIPGVFRCKRCRAKKRQCVFQCMECYKKGSLDKDKFPCVNCKVTMEDPPVNYNFVEENNKIYLKLEDNDIKIEITQEKFEDLLKLQNFNRNFTQSPTQSFILDSPINNNTSGIRPDICSSTWQLPVDSEVSDICIQPFILQGGHSTGSDVYQQQIDSFDQFLLNDNLSLYYDLF